MNGSCAQSRDRGAIGAPGQIAAKAADQAPKPGDGRQATRRIGPVETLALLRAQFTHAAGGAGELYLINGGVASGKTRVLNDFLDFATKEGARVLSATGAPDEQAFSSGIIDQLFAGPTLEPAVCERVSQILAPLRSGAFDEPGAERDRHEVAGPIVRELCQVLLHLAQERPTVIGVDDVQFADSTSVLLLLHLQRRLRSGGPMIVLSQWDRPSTGDRHLHTYFARHPHHHVHLAPMSRQAVCHLLADALGADFNDELPGLVHDLSAGNPMLVGSLIDDLRIHGRGHEPADGAFSQAVLAYLDRWEQLPLREVAGAIAVFGSTASTEVVAKLAGVGVTAAQELTDILTGGGLLAEGRFRHPLAESAALGGLAPEARSRLHVRAAELKFRQDAPAKEVAAHLIAADTTDVGWAVPVLRKAAEHAVAADEIEFARQCLELALCAGKQPAQTRAILGSLARVVWRVNPSASSSYLVSMQHAEGTQDDAAALARHALWQGDEAGFARALEGMAGPGGGINSRIWAELRLADQWCFNPAASRLADQRGLDLPGGDPWDLTTTTLSRIWTHGGGPETTASAEQILRNCHLEDATLEALMTAVLALVYADKADKAELWWRALNAEAERRGAVTWQAMLGAFWSGVVLRGGDVPGAAEMADRSLRLLGSEGWGAAISYPLAALLMAATESGAFDQASETLRHPVPDAMYRTVGGLRYLRARGHYHLATNRLLAAVSDFQECRRLMERWGVDLPVLVPWRADLASANLRLGNLPTAHKLAQQQLELTADTDSYTHGLALRVLAFTGDPAERQATLTRSAERFTRCGDRLEAARTLRMIERIQQRHGGEPGVLDAAGRAIMAMRNAGSTRMPAPQTYPATPAAANPAGAQPRRVPATPARTVVPAQRSSGGQAKPEVLSAAELPVAQLAALGRTNQEISNSLFITVSTVEQHLTRVYRKLGIKRRTDLAGKLALNRAEKLAQEWGASR